MHVEVCGLIVYMFYLIWLPYTWLNFEKFRTKIYSAKDAVFADAAKSML